MKKCFRLLTSLVLVSLVLVSVVGCHGSASGKDDLAPFAVPENFDTSKTYEITFWAKNESNTTQAAIYRKAVQDFQALYPNIKVNLKIYTDYGRIYSDVITNIPTDTTPNVCITYPDHIATYITGGNRVISLDEVFTDEKYGLGGSELRFDGPTYDEMIPKFLSEGVIDGKQYAIPYMRSTEACYVNKTLVEKLGYTLPETLTWDFIWEVSEAAMKKDKDGNYLINGQKVMIPFIYKSTDNMMIQMLKQKNAEYSTDEGDILLFNDDTTAILTDIAEHAESGAFSTFKISSYPGNFLNAGQCIFAIDSTAGATWMGTKAPHLDIEEDQMVDFELVVKGIPQYDTENPVMISQGPSICVFNKEDPQEVLASWLFAQFLLTNEIQISYSQTEGYVPVTYKAQKSPEYVDYLSRSGEEGELYYYVKLDAVKLLLENTDNTFVTPVFNGSASLRNAAGHLIEDVTKSEQWGENVDEEYIKSLYSNTNSLYHLDQIGMTEEQDFGILPPVAIGLISGIIIVWLLMGAYLLWNLIKNYQKRKEM